MAQGAPKAQLGERRGFNPHSGKKDNRNISDVFEIRPDPIMDCGVSCP